MKKNEFYTKWYYRLLKVIYIFLYTLGIIMSLGVILFVIEDSLSGKYELVYIPLSLLGPIFVFIFFEFIRIIFFYIFFGEWKIDSIMINKIIKLKKKNRRTKNKSKKDVNKIIKVDFKSKLLNIFIHIIFLGLSIVVSFLYTISKEYKLFNDGDYYAFLNSLSSSFLVLYLLGIYLYIKVRGKLGDNFKYNLKKFLKGIIPMLVLLLVYYGIYNSNKSNTMKDLDSISSSFGESLEKYDGDYNKVFEDIKGIETDSSLGKAIQKYLLDRQNINEKYQKSINSLGDTLLGDEYYNDINEINNVISNLKQLGKITEEYISGTDKVKKENRSIQNMFSSDLTIELDKIRTDFVESEKKFITSSIETYSYLLDIQQHIEYNNGEINIYDDNIRNKFNGLIEIMNSDLIEYQNKADELQKYREKMVEDNAEMMRINNNLDKLDKIVGSNTYTREEFAKILKSVFPEYKDTDNQELVNKFLGKFIEYNKNIKVNTGYDEYYY